MNARLRWFFDRWPRAEIVYTALMVLWRSSLWLRGVKREFAAPVVVGDRSALLAELRESIEHLSLSIGPRNAFLPAKYKEAEEYLGLQLQRMGYEVRRQTFTVNGDGRVECVNLDVEIPGVAKREEIVVFGAHYDSVPIRGGCPAANDNGSGVAAVLAIAKRLHGVSHVRTIRFVLFANEEPPYFFSQDMGSYKYAEACHARGEKIVAMITPETIGCFTNTPGSQRFPIRAFGLLPTRGSFIAVVGAKHAANLVGYCAKAMRRRGDLPVLGAALPEEVSMIEASDHWSFGQFGYPGLMVTDTAPFRYPHYHTPQDTPDKIDFERMTVVVERLEDVVRGLARGDAIKP